MDFRSFYQTLGLLGRVKSTAPQERMFQLVLLTGDELDVHVGETTYYQVLNNIDNEDRNRVPPSDDHSLKDDVSRNLHRYLRADRLISIVGVYSSHGDDGVRFEARRVVLMHSEVGRYGWEDTHWWRRQIQLLTEQWLNSLYENRSTITKNDVAKLYQSNLDLLGGRQRDDTQECATLSRFLYGLSSCYLLSGNERAFWAAKATAEYLCENFAETTHDQHYCFWKYARVKTDRGEKDIVASQNYDDEGSYALYEQIYALSGLAQYFRITHDRHVLNYIRQTIAAFEDFFRDKKKQKEGKDGSYDDPVFTGQGGYFSHIDTVTMRPDSPSLRLSDGRDNFAKKNWNSIGDHIPAYLVNLLVAIDPAPPGVDYEDWQSLLSLCQEILDDCVTNILDYFFEEGCDFVLERFHADWTPDKKWGWQRDLAIVGHNLKIAWNLTRCAHHYRCRERYFELREEPESAEKYRELAERCYNRAKEVGEKMGRVGFDLIRGGIFDAVQRQPTNSMPTEFAWGTTKDFWQQEQAILAYYILYAVDHDSTDDDTHRQRERFLELARYSSAFWNLYFLDHDYRKAYFRTTESGEPVIEGNYGIQGGHAIAGYHAFELSYLAHLYIRNGISGVPGADQTFTVTFRPQCGTVKAINVLPDFFRPGEVEIVSVRVNGDKVYDHISSNYRIVNYQVTLDNYPCDSTVVVEYRAAASENAMSCEQQAALCPTPTRLNA